MKKIILLLCSLMILVGCSCSMNDNKPEEAVKSFFEKYRNKDDNIITQLKETIENEMLDDDMKEDYQDLMEKQYDQFAYVIKDIKEENGNATAEVELTVLDYKSAILKVEEEVEKNPDKFRDESGKLKEDEYRKYKIEKMKKVDKTTNYTLDLNLVKENGIWKVEQLSNDDIKKLHGLY